MNSFNKLKQKGQIIIMTAFSIIILIGAVGLAIDSGLGYIIKAKLNAAVDAAGIAGARALSQGNTQADQRDKAMQAATKFFYANYPNGYLGSTPTLSTLTVTFPEDGAATCISGRTCIDVSANAVVPVRFMQIFNFDLLHVSTSAQAVRQDVDMAFVLDITGSMSLVAASVRDRAQKFLDHFNPLRDRVALVSFKYGALVNDTIWPILRGFDRTTMDSHISALNFSGNTNFGEGFWQARNQLNSVPITPTGNRSNLRVIVFFTDGSPNTFASIFPVRRMITPAPASDPASDPAPTCSGSYNTCDCSGSSTNTGTCTKAPKVACSCTCTGSLVTGDGSSGTPIGLYQHESTNGNPVVTPSGYSGVDSCNRDISIISSSTGNKGIYQLPGWYNAPHNGVVPLAGDPEFHKFQIAPQPSVPPGLRSISTLPSNNATSNANINRASRNLAEEMAWVARNEGIYVFVLGLGDLLHGAAGPDNEIGETLLKCMANTDEGGLASITPNPLCYQYNQNNGLNLPGGKQPVGTYCWAYDDQSLGTCYDKLASQILRLSR